MVSFCARGTQAKLEGQIECWGEMLFHIDLWSREARRRERTDVVELLQDQHEQATSAIERAHEELNMLRRTDTPGERGDLGALRGEGGEVLTRGPLKRGSLPLPARGVQQFSGELPGLRRRCGRLIWSAPSSCSRQALVTASLLAPIMVPRCSCVGCGYANLPGRCTPSLLTRKRIRLASLAGTSLRVTSCKRVS